MGYPLDVALPLDMNGKPDFMDAWSAVCKRLGADQMTAADFATLMKKAEEEDGEQVVKGPTDNCDYNAFLVMAPRKDALASKIFWLMSTTQLLNCIQAVTMGARGFIPNLYNGSTAACLTRYLMSDREPSSFHLARMQDMLYSLRLVAATIIAIVYKCKSQKDKPTPQ